MKLYAAFLLVLLIVLQYKLWFEEGGYFYNRELEKQLQAMQDENERLRERNRELSKKILLIKDDLDTIESYARRNLGMIKEGETFVVIVKDDAKDKARQDKAAEQVVPDEGGTKQP